MRLIAYITEGTQTGKILEHIGVDSEPPRIAQRAVHRCGRTVMRRWARVCKSNWTGIWLRNRHPPLMPIRASTGERAMKGRTGDSNALRGRPATGLPGAPKITLTDRTFYW